MIGSGFAKGMWVTLRHFINTYVDDVRYGFRKFSPNVNNFQDRQGPHGEGIFTVQYPDEKIAMAERFRFVPFLVVEDYDHPPWQRLVYLVRHLREGLPPPVYLDRSR